MQLRSGLMLGDWTCWPGIGVVLDGPSCAKASAVDRTSTAMPAVKSRF